MPLLDRVMETLRQLRSHHRRRLAFLNPPIERRRPRIQMEDYAARHSIDHTLDRKAELRRMAPGNPQAAARYHQLLTYELTGLRIEVADDGSTSPVPEGKPNARVALEVDVPSFMQAFVDRLD